MTIYISLLENIFSQKSLCLPFRRYNESFEDALTRLVTTVMLRINNNKRQRQTEAVKAPSSTARCDAKYH
jgi:hypothetical protein